MATAQRDAYLKHTLLILTIQCVFIFGKYNCSLPADGPIDQPGLKLDHEYAMFQEDATKPACELVYSEYLQAIENFTHCEIYHVTPFNLCLKCHEEYKAVTELFSQLNSNPDLENCKTRYMMSDRVQIIVTVQANVDKMWRKSHCHRCYERNGTLRERVSEFLTLHSIFRACVKKTTEDDSTPGNRSDVCIQCKAQYTSLNAHFNGIYDADAGDVCMDIMNMMNYTRIDWTSAFNCTCGSYDSTPVVVISCFVACTPIVFYVYLRLTGKVRKAKLFKPKRLASSSEGFSGSYPSNGNLVHSN